MGPVVPNERGDAARLSTIVRLSSETLLLAAGLGTISGIFAPWTTGGDPHAIEDGLGTRILATCVAVLPAYS